MCRYKLTLFTLCPYYTQQAQLPTLTHTVFQNPHAFGCRVLRGEMPVARVVLSNNTLKLRERGVKQKEEKKKVQSAEYVF